MSDVAPCLLCGRNRYSIFPYEAMGLCSGCARKAGAAWVKAHCGRNDLDLDKDENQRAIERAKEYKKREIPEKLRWRVFQRDGFRCNHCGSQSMLRVDHIVAESKGGRLEMNNLQTLCDPCNTKKGRH